MRCPSETKWFG